MTTKITLNNIADTALATLTGPKVTTIVYPGTETATDVVGGATINLTGGGFQSGCSVLVASTASSVVTFISSTQISFIAPALAAGTYVIYVINPDGGTAISIPGISYSGTPNWTTTAGSLGNAYETGAISATLTATGDAPITYTLASGTLPTGSTLASNGTLSGTAVATASATTYTFAVTAKDAQNQTTNRSFSLTINPDVVTWSSPADSATYTVEKDIVMANVTMSATSAAGGSITYTADTLPTGLSITGANIAGTPTVTSNTTTVLTATATSTRAATRTINWVVSVASDTYFKNTTLLLSGNGTNNTQNNTFLDGSTNNFTITRNGNPTQGTFSPYGSNWSNYFNGGAGATLVGLTNNSMTAVGTGICTVELWVYLSSTGFDQHFYDLGTTGFSIHYAFAENKFAVYNRITGTDIFGTYSVTSNYNNWYHLAFVRSGTGTNQTAFYVNGVLSATTTNSTNFTSTSVTIGSRFALFSGVAYGALGYLSNVRYTNTVVYSSAFTPSTTPLTAISGTRLLTCQSNRFIDNSVNALVLTVNGTPTVQRYSPFSPGTAYNASTIGGSGYFDGTGDYLTAPCPSMSGTWTIELWLYPTLGGTQQTFVSFNSGGVAGINIWMDSSNQIVVDDGQVASGLFTGGTFKIGAWNHTAIVRNGTTTTAYINGVSVGSNSFTPSGVNTISVGRYNGGSFYYIKGYISNLRVVIGTAVYTSAFTPPTSPVTAITNTQVLLNYTNAGIIDNTMLNNLETVGDAKISTTQSKFGGSSMSFDGTGDWLFVPSNPVIAFGTGDFTVECWIYMNVIPSGESYPGIFEIGNTLFINFRASGTIGLTDPTTVYAQSGSSLVAGTWYHVAIVRASGSSKIYVNGVGGTAVTYTYNVTQTTATIGGGANGPTQVPFSINGYIDDLRITKGYARYTANFTPPTSAFNGR